MRGPLTKLALAALSALVPWAWAGAQPSPSPAPSPAPKEPAAVAPDSPRASVERYLDLCRKGDYVAAGHYLSLPRGGAEPPQTLARRLKAVLDRHLWIDLEQVSGDPQGNPDDGLPPGVDELGHIPWPHGSPRAVRVNRLEDDAGARWVFTRSTVASVDGWYAALDDRFVREHLPDALLRPGPFELLIWQWLALPLLLALAYGVARPLAWITRGVLRRLTARTDVEWDDLLVRRLGRPLAVGWTLALVYVTLPALELYAPAHAALVRTLAALAVATVFWALWRAVDVAADALQGSPWGALPATRSLVSVGSRLAKVMLAGLGLVAALTELGYPVGGLVAGLGLGGLAMALAAQKTVENLFGSFALAVDRPFAVGDFVRVDDFVGTVEAIGLRSTRIRTLDRTLISLPNGRLADMRLESFTARDRLRLACTLGVVYGTTEAQMRAVLEGFERVLRSHPKIWPDVVVVRFKEFGASSLDIEIMAWFRTSDWGEFQLIRQEVLLGFMRVVEEAGTGFAFPTRTVHLVGGGA